MNFVYLSPHFPPNFINFAVQLRALGANVLGLADVPYEQLSPLLQGALTEYYRVDDLHSYDQLVRALGFFTHRYGKIDRIDSHAEYWLETEANLRTDFNITGIKNDVIRQMKSKSEMKEIFREAGVAVARGQVVQYLEQARDFVTQVGYPLVAKPDIGVGAAATYKVDNDGQLEDVFRDKPAGDTFLEEFIVGQLYSFDGLVNRDGELVFFTSHHFSQGIMETVNNDDHIFYYSLREIPADMEDAGRKLIKAFDLRERFFHFEFFRTTKDHRLVALEVNMRPPGGLTTDMFNYANDIDIYREWANVVMHNRFEVHYDRRHHCGYVGRKYSKNYRHSREEILARYGTLVCHHEEIQSIFAPAIGNYAFLLKTESLDVAREAAGYILELA